MMGVRETANKLLSRLLGNSNALVTARRRSLALNGNDQARRALVKQSRLDAQTLEILARRGPGDVTVAVAKHPSLDLATARYLWRINNPAITLILESRFGEALRAPSYAIELSAEPNHDAPDSAETTSIDDAGIINTATVSAADSLKESPDPAEPGAHPNPASAQLGKTPEVVTASDNSLPDPGISGTVAPEAVTLPLGNDKPIELTEAPHITNEWTTADFSLLLAEVDGQATTPDNADPRDTTDQEFDFLDSVELLELSPDHLLAHLESHGRYSGEDQASSDLHDQAAELRFIREFQKTPTGKAGSSLLGALTEGAHAPKLHLLVELYRTGLSADELAIAWQVRESWNSANSDKCSLTYRDIGAIMRTFDSTPDPDEVMLLLNTLLDNFRLERPRKYFYQYLDELTASLEQFQRGDQYFPLEFLASARNYH